MRIIFKSSGKFVQLSEAVSTSTKLLITPSWARMLYTRFACGAPEK